MTNEFTHLVYKASSLDDVINRLSPDGYELASDELADYLDLVRPDIPLNIPVILELTGLDLNTSQQQAVVRGLSAIYQNRLEEVNRTVHRCWIKTLWFLLCLIASSVLIFLCNNSLNEVLVQYLYLPFWFFAYRVITFPLLDLQPVRLERQRLKHFMEMQILFTKEQTSETLGDCLDKDTALFSLDCSILDTYRITDGNQLSLRCLVHDLGDVLHPASTPGRELVSAEMDSYLEQAECFVTGNTSVSLIITGASFTPEQQATIDAAIRHFYSLYNAELRQTTAMLHRKVVLFAVGTIVSSIALFLMGNFVDVAFHELLIIVLWFFGEYLIEFLLLDNLALFRQRRAYRRLQSLTLTFE